MVGNANANGIPFLKRYGIPPAIKNSMVLWYDIARQGATNESMAENPILKDLSGNGHDITCYNFAWSGMSGIGGYTNFNRDYTRADIELLGEQHWLINSINQDKDVNKECILASKKAFNTFFCDKKIQVKLTGNVLSETFFRINYTRIYLKEGVNEITIPAIDSEDFINTEYLVFNFPLETVNVEVEILPLYPNALVSDGVDDYALCSTLPTLDDFTVIAKREIFDTDKYTFASTSDIPNTGFIIETKSDSGSTNEIYSFGRRNIIPLTSGNIIYVTPTSYNGRNILKGTNNNSNKLHLFQIRLNDYRKMEGALYSFLLFDRTLTTAEIEWVKKNMIESGGGVLKTDWSDSSLWAFYNRYNEGRIDGTISSNRMVITSNGIRPGIGATANFMEVIVENSIVPAYKIKVTGLKNGIVLSYIDGTINIRISEDGIYSIPEHNTQDIYFGYRFNKAFENENIVIQQLLSLRILEQ